MANIEVDAHVQAPTIYTPDTSLLHQLQVPYWNAYSEKRLTTIFEAGGLIMDIGGGLRIDITRGNKVDDARVKTFGHFLQRENVDYKITDYTEKYDPDFVEDIHNLSFADNSIDSLICLAVLEHVYDPKKAAEEMLRVVRPGGLLLLYAPYIYRYHAHKEDYYDYYRYSKDGWGYLFRDASSIEICPVRGLFESLVRFTPLHYFQPLNLLCRALDSSCARMQKISQVQASGYNVFIVK